MRHLALLVPLALTACGSQPDADPPAAPWAADGQAGLPLTMDLVMTDPLVAGGPISIEVTGAAPRADLKLIRAKDGAIAPGGCPPVLGGACLDITSGTSGYVVTLDLQANASGTATFTGTLPGTLPPQQLAFQVVDPVALTGSLPIQRTVVNCTDDFFEDNDTPFTGLSVVPGALDLVACPFDDDYFGYLVPDGDVISATASFDHAVDGDLDLALADQGGTVVDLSETLLDTERVSWANFSGIDQTIILRASAFDDPGGDGIPYRLVGAIDPPAPCVDDASEDDDDLASAALITPGTPALRHACHGDDDWLAFPVTAGDTVSVEMQYDLQQVDIDARVVDPTGSTFVTLDFDFSLESYTFVAPTSGDWHIVTELSTDRGDGSGGDYGVLVEIVP